MLSMARSLRSLPMRAMSEGCASSTRTLQRLTEGPLPVAGLGLGEAVGGGLRTGAGLAPAGQTLPEPGGTVTLKSRPAAQAPGAWLVSQNCVRTHGSN